MTGTVHEMAPLVLQHDGAGAERHQQGNSTSLVPSAGMFAGLTRLERELQVTVLVEHTAATIREARKAGEPAEVMSAYKDQAAAIADLSKRVDVAKDIILDTQVVQRSAERGLGSAIRAGQADGTIRAQGTNAKVHVAGIRGSVSRKSEPDVHDDRVSPEAFFTHGEERRDIYALADNGTEEDFDAALVEAREEGNVSRANVVRKLKDRVARDEADQANREARRGDMQAWHEQLSEKYPLPRLAFEAEGHERHSTVEAFASAARETYKVGYRFNEKTYAKHVAQSQTWLENVAMSIEVSRDVLSHIDYSTITPEQADDALQRIDLRQLKKFITNLEGIKNND